jgi:hypothetical protein
MNQLNKNNSLEELLRDTKHNKKAKELFLKLLGKQRKPANPFNVSRTKTYQPDDKSDIRNEMEVR